MIFRVIIPRNKRTGGGLTLNIDYYFRKPEKFPIPGFLAELREPWEILALANTFLENSLVKHDIRENHGSVCIGNGGEASSPVFHNSYYIDGGSVIYNGVTIIGPVYIGRNVEIMPGALIRPYTIIGDGCSVGHGSEVKHVVMFGGAKIASLAFAGDSVLGASARLGSGVITANRKFDQSEVSLKLPDGKKNLGADKFGLILGDSSRLGANCVTQPGTHIGPNTWVFPGVAARGFIPENTRVAEERTLRFSPNAGVELKP
ncbi:MAG: hypothetical protein LBK23_00745 [Oscillospiraceae bacterium]|jgi:bifunctional UDP-N-acetylglucosamine pyrophosphorylase/glucosamine-1-phosphate N-acetyltransferase|nr:hypothetical protein [Oscillospiraceae bacterium]